MSEPLTDAERKERRNWATLVLSWDTPPESAKLRAQLYLQCEATLQAKDAQIEALMTALRAMYEEEAAWTILFDDEEGEASHVCCFCEAHNYTGEPIQHSVDCSVLVALAAIKEATNGS